VGTEVVASMLSSTERIQILFRVSVLFPALPQAPSPDTHQMNFFCLFLRDGKKNVTFLDRVYHCELCLIDMVV
jgi:hypothetical protein